MNKKFVFYTVVLTAGLLTACSSDNEQGTMMRRISVEVNQQTMVSDDEVGARSMSTRSAITTSATFNTFNMRGVYDNMISNYTVSKSADTWTVEPDTWPNSPVNDAAVPFYAFTGGKFQANDGAPYISFTMAEDAFTQHDLLVATNTVSYNDHQGKVPLTFDHACAAVAFNVQISNTLKAYLGNTTLTVKSIVLRNVSNSGRYYLGSTPVWGNVEGSSYYTLTDGDITVNTDAQPLRSNYLFVIPQSRVANGTKGTYLEVNYEYSGSKQATIPLAVNWEAGKQYTINIKLGTTLIK